LVSGLEIGFAGMDRQVVAAKLVAENSIKRKGNLSSGFGGFWRRFIKRTQKTTKS
jgi:hypothetical protein